MYICLQTEEIRGFPLLWALYPCAERNVPIKMNIINVSMQTISIIWYFKYFIMFHTPSFKDTIPNWFSLCFTMALHAISTYFKN